MVAAAVLLGGHQAVRPGGRDPEPEEQLHAQQDPGAGAVPHAEEGQAGGRHRLLRRSVICWSVRIPCVSCKQPSQHLLSQPRSRDRTERVEEVCTNSSINQFSY